MELKSGITSINDRYSNQKQKILHHLERFGSISPLEALQHYGCMRLAAQILELKKDGVEIVTTMRQKDDKQWAEYWLEERFRREHKQVTDFNLARSGESMPLPKAFFKQCRILFASTSEEPA